MFYIVGNKRCMNIRTARAEAYKIVKKTERAIDIHKATARGSVDYATVNFRKGLVYFTPLGGRTYLVYKDGSTKE